MSTLFNGTTEFGSYTPIRMNGATAFSMTMQINFASLPGTQIMISRTVAAAQPFQWEFQATAAGALIAVWDNAGAFGTGQTANGTVTTATNYHLAMIFNGVGASNDEKWKIYVNGTYTGALTFGGAAPIGTLATGLSSQMFIASRNGTASFTNAYFEDIRMWDIALSAQDVANDYISNVPDYPERLVTWLPMTGKTNLDTYTPLSQTFTHNAAGADGGSPLVTKSIYLGGAQPARQTIRMANRVGSGRRSTSNPAPLYKGYPDGI